MYFKMLTRAKPFFLILIEHRLIFYDLYYMNNEQNLYCISKNYYYFIRWNL